ncbi:MAG: glycosyltransferase, partial [Acetobacterales bacterium]
MTVRVLVNALHAKSGGGVTYLRHILPRLAADPELDVHLLLHPAQAALYPDAGVTVHHADFRAGFVREMAWEQCRLPRLARRIGAAATFSPANFGPLLAPGSVVLLRNALDVARVENRPAKRLYWAALSAMTFLSLVFCRRAIAVSGYARRSLARLPALARKTVVVHHGVDDLFRGGPAGRREDFLLAVADLYVQKNLLALIDAVALLRQRRPDVRLRIAGAPVDPGYAASVRARIAEHRLDEAVTLLGTQPKERLAELYRRCAVFVFPSTVETFGQPLAEAMASGAPIACADAAAMPEVLGDA